MSCPRVYADFHNADRLGRLRLNSRGTLEDLKRQHVTIRDGLQITLCSEDLEADGEVVFSSEEKVWISVIDWDAIRQFDEIEQPAAVDDEGS